MFIKEFSDEQIVYFRMTLSPDFFTGWFTAPTAGKLIGYVTFDRNHSPHISGLEYEGRHYLQLVELDSDDIPIVLLYAWEEVFDVTSEELNKIKENTELKLFSLVLNPGNK